MDRASKLRKNTSSHLWKSINHQELQKFIELKYLCTATTGLTHIDHNYLKNTDIKLVSLAGEKLSQDRIRFMLNKGKPLRN